MMMILFSYVFRIISQSHKNIDWWRLCLFIVSSFVKIYASRMIVCSVKYCYLCLCQMCYLCYSCLCSLCYSLAQVAQALVLLVLLTCQMKKQQRRPICIEPLYRRSTISLIKSLAEHQKKKHSVSSILQSVCWSSSIVVRFWQQRFSSSALYCPQQRGRWAFRNLDGINVRLAEAARRDWMWARGLGEDIVSLVV